VKGGLAEARAARVQLESDVPEQRAEYDSCVK